MKTKIGRKNVVVMSSIIIAALLVGYTTAQTFNFIFNPTRYAPNKYSWLEPWEVHQTVDFISATLVVNGSGYQGENHVFTLTFLNIAPDADSYVLTSFNYQVLWKVVTVNETLTSGSYSGALLVGSNVKYTGSFTPSIYGSGNILMTVTNIVWVEKAPITWTVTPVNTYTDYVTIASLTVQGCAKTYETEQIVATFSGPSAYVSFDLQTPDGTFHFTDRPTATQFTYNIGPYTTGGAKTVTLTVTGAHN